MTLSEITITLLQPDVERDAPFAHSWFARPEGHDTLLSMGNAEHEIEPSTLEGEREIMQEFIDLEYARKQITRAIIVGDITVGIVWIELFENHNVKSPSIHIMIGDPDYRGKGIGKQALRWGIEYTRDRISKNTLYSRHLVSNNNIKILLHSLGFVDDGVTYVDENNLVWRNVTLNL